MDTQAFGILNNPIVVEYSKRILELMQDPNFTKACQNIVQYPDLKTYYVSLLGTFIGYGIIRYWLLSKIENWISRWAMSILMYLIFPAVLLGVSYLFFGNDLIVVLKGVYHLFFASD